MRDTCMLSAIKAQHPLTASMSESRLTTTSSIFGRSSLTESVFVIGGPVDSKMRIDPLVLYEHLNRLLSQAATGLQIIDFYGARLEYRHSLSDDSEHTIEEEQLERHEREDADRLTELYLADFVQLHPIATSRLDASQVAKLTEILIRIHVENDLRIPLSPTAVHIAYWDLERTLVA